MIKNWKNHCGLRNIFAFADRRLTAISSLLLVARLKEWVWLEVVTVAQVPVNPVSSRDPATADQQNDFSAYQRLNLIVRGVFRNHLRTDFTLADQKKLHCRILMDLTRRDVRSSCTDPGGSIMPCRYRASRSTLFSST
jgi:hypothetical protein